MILIAKPGRGPVALAAGAAETVANCTKFDADPPAYRAGREKFTFLSRIYGPPAVKTALKRTQYCKCCFCESVFEATYAGDVEHYRPKGAIGVGKQRIRPGYYWLAYSWDNLYYSCADCNQYRKRAAFPLADEAKRTFDHHGALAGEDPLILDPGGPRDPRDHIRFNQDVPIGTSDAGRTTVDLIKLDREALCSSRRKHFRLLDALLQIIRLNRCDPRPTYIQAVREARSELAAYMRPEAEFSAASQDFLAPFPHLLDEGQP